jgi:beta-phosphoglucomutase-like phosphatase (HAD superfamily)
MRSDRPTDARARAVILDIDGTLLESDDIDGSLYLAAVRKVLGEVRIRDSWGLYRNVTDGGILHEILRDNFLPLTPKTLNAVRAFFVESMARHIEINGPFTEIPGAKDFVSGLLASTSSRIAYATGGWSESAAMKLGSAGFPMQGIPLASSDDYIERQSIMLHALDQLGTEFESITYYGDGKWDETATRMLGWDFVPVGKRLGGLRSFRLVDA